MQKRFKVLAIISLLIFTLHSFLVRVPAFAQDTNPGSISNQLALLAIAPPPGNSGILDLYQFSDVSGGPAIKVAIPGYPLSASWSPDGAYLAFIMITQQPGSSAPPSDFDIYRIDRQGAGLLKLTDTPNCPEIGLVWSPDSQALFFSAFCRDSQATTFWRLDLAAGASTKLGEVQWDGTWAVWSPDASKVALLAPRKAEDGTLYDEVLLATPDGQAVSNLADDAHPGYQLQQSTVLAWSPQSDWLAYATKAQDTGQGVSNQIVLLGPDGAGRRVLYTSQPGQECLNPLWSSDGQRLAFTCSDSLFIINSDGADLRNLTAPSAGQVVEYMAWTPGGESLAFISLASDGKRRLESVKIDSAQRQEIAEVLAVQTFALAWNPVPQPVSPPADQVVNLTQASPAVSPSVDQVVEVTSNSTPVVLQEDQSENLAPDAPVGQAANSTSLWLLVLLLAAGGGGVFLLLRRIGRLPALETRKEGRRGRQGLAHNGQPVRSVETGGSLVRYVGEQIQPDRESDYGSSQGYEEVPAGSELLQHGINQVRSRDIHAGITTLRQYLDVYPDDPNAWLWLGWACALVKEYRTAERCFLRSGRLGSAQAGEALQWLKDHRQ